MCSTAVPSTWHGAQLFVECVNGQGRHCYFHFTEVKTGWNRVRASPSHGQVLDKAESQSHHVTPNSLMHPRNRSTNRFMETPPPPSPQLWGLVLCQLCPLSFQPGHARQLGPWLKTPWLLTDFYPFAHEPASRSLCRELVLVITAREMQVLLP